ncbi:F-box/LRR-repeat protein At3g26922-like [Rutidosis leptorrhynchoides]|uniref:F-box/LRR-repeat protein At3g26922-like n=1 Tax=Rutidosis leptorrhynchoides TaxID=125765 RepID=UPI003A991A3B
MDSSRKQKILKIEIDRLSNLPEELIHKILSFMGTKHVVQTSALSSRWKYTWTSMPYLDFSSNDFAELLIFSKCVTHVLSGRNNEVQVSSLKLKFHINESQVFVKRVLDYAVSHNVQQMTVTCLVKKDTEFPLSLFSFPSVKHLSLTTEYSGSRRGYDIKFYMNLRSTWELLALTTLHLNYVTFCDGNTGIFSKCANLKNLTIKHCKTKSPNGLIICHPQLSNLTLEDGHRSVKVVNVVAPQLENLTIMNCHENRQHLVSAPNLTSLVYKGFDPLHLNTDGFHLLEKADLCISPMWCSDPHEIVCLLVQLHSVKSLTLNLEIVEAWQTGQVGSVWLTGQNDFGLKCVMVQMAPNYIDNKAIRGAKLGEMVTGDFNEGTSKNQICRDYSFITPNHIPSIKEVDHNSDHGFHGPIV